VPGLALLVAILAVTREHRVDLGGLLGRALELGAELLGRVELAVATAMVAFGSIAFGRGLARKLGCALFHGLFRVAGSGGEHCGDGEQQGDLAVHRF
jgi:hypothetical protein